MKAVEPDWERVDVHCLAMTLWLLATGENNPPRGPLLAGGEYCLAHRLDHDYLPQLDGVLAAATNESPKARSSLDAFEQGLRGRRASRYERASPRRWIGGELRGGPFSDGSCRS